MQCLNQKYDDNIASMRRKKTKEEKHPQVIEEPRPGANHVICAICREQFKDYLEHIFSARHQRGVKQNQQIFSQIDALIEDIAEFQENKRIISEQRSLEESVPTLVSHSKHVLNPELLPSTKDELSSGAGKSSVGSDLLTNSASTATSVTNAHITASSSSINASAPIHEGEHLSMR
jgi:cell division septum initiation protein DivIVA